MEDKLEESSRKSEENSRSLKVRMEVICRNLEEQSENDCRKSEGNKK